VQELRRTLSGFEPADDHAREYQKALKVGQVVRAKVSIPRDYRNHCHFICLLDLTFENQERYTNRRMFRRAVALAAGHVDQIITLDGEVHLVPLSYDYATLPDEAEFVVRFAEAMTVCAGILRMEAPELEQQVARYASDKYGIAA
jgi:hypothetical protein